MSGKQLFKNRFAYEEDAGKAVDDLNSRFYAGRPLYCELSPVTDFGEACCRQYENSECTRGGFCNFMHLKPVSKMLKRELYQGQRLSIEALKPRGDQIHHVKKVCYSDCAIYDAWIITCIYKSLI
jgi:splicing factor U2AF 35 kDa subunit